MRLVDGKLPVMASWLWEDGCRLDARPFLSGAFEKRKQLEALKVPKERLPEVTMGGMDGIFHAGREGRLWVQDPSAGVPFLGSTDIFAMDFSNLPLLSKERVKSNPKFIIHEGWTLITRSGTTGRMAFARAEMDGFACSEHVLRVAPDPNLIPPGYLYAYLSSSYGVPLVVGSTYGAIIQPIEPQHLAQLPVPRLGSNIEAKVHELVHEAADTRSQSARLLRQTHARLLEIWGVQDLDRNAPRQHPDIQIIDSSRFFPDARFDAFYYSALPIASDRLLAKIGTVISVKELGKLVDEVFETTRFGRLKVDDPQFGVPFFSISDLMQIDPDSKSYISLKQAEVVRARVKEGWLILPRMGQLQGVFGTIIFISERLDDVAVSDNNLRIVPADSESGAYLWAALSTTICYAQIIRQACGTSIPYLDAKRLSRIPVPWADKKARREIAKMVIEAMTMRSQAAEWEHQATRLVETTIRGAA